MFQPIPNDEELLAIFNELENGPKESGTEHQHDPEHKEMCFIHDQITNSTFLKTLIKNDLMLATGGDEFGAIALVQAVGMTLQLMFALGLKAGRLQSQTEELYKMANSNANNTSTS